jgi:protein-tyrosine phosphatase
MESSPIGVLFVCLGNICRSPMAEGVFRHVADQAGLVRHFSIDSAGTSGWHRGEPPDHRAQRASLKRGIDIGGQSSRAVDDRDFERFDYILAMDRDNLDALTGRQPAESRSRLALLLTYAESDTLEVPDPYYGGTQGFDHALDLIFDGARGLLEDIRKDHRL